MALRLMRLSLLLLLLTALLALAGIVPDPDLAPRQTPSSAVPTSATSPGYAGYPTHYAGSPPTPTVYFTISYSVGGYGGGGPSGVRTTETATATSYGETTVVYPSSDTPSATVTVSVARTSERTAGDTTTTSSAFYLTSSGVNDNSTGAASRGGVHLANAASRRMFGQAVLMLLVFQCAQLL